MASTTNPNEPQPRETEMHLYRPAEPARGVITKNELCTASRKAAGFIRHVEIDVSGTDLVGRCQAGQSLGVIPPGEDENGRPHKVRLYSLASPSVGEDGQGRIYSTTVKRTIDEHWDDHRLFLGVASNFLCDAQEGDEVQLTGPAGKRFVLPAETEAHDYLFIATGTGIAPFRGMVKELLNAGSSSRITLIMGAPYATDLLYHDYFLRAAEEHKNFHYLTAISRERQHDGHDKMYVQNRMETDADHIMPLLNSDRTLVYICGVAGMEIGVFREMATRLKGSALEQYLRVEPEALRGIDAWSRRMINREIKPTRRVMLEVYA